MASFIDIVENIGDKEFINERQIMLYKSVVVT